MWSNFQYFQLFNFSTFVYKKPHVTYQSEIDFIWHFEMKLRRGHAPRHKSSKIAKNPESLTYILRNVKFNVIKCSTFLTFQRFNFCIQETTCYLSVGDQLHLTFWTGVAARTSTHYGTTKLYRNNINIPSTQNIKESNESSTVLPLSTQTSKSAKKTSSTVLPLSRPTSKNATTNFKIYFDSSQQSRWQIRIR